MTRAVVTVFVISMWCVTITQIVWTILLQNPAMAVFAGYSLVTTYGTTCNLIDGWHGS